MKYFTFCCVQIIWHLSVLNQKPAVRNNGHVDTEDVTIRSLIIECRLQKDLFFSFLLSQRTFWLVTGGKSRGVADNINGGFVLFKCPQSDMTVWQRVSGHKTTEQLNGTHSLCYLHLGVPCCDMSTCLLWKGPLCLVFRKKVTVCVCFWQNNAQARPVLIRAWWCVNDSDHDTHTNIHTHTYIPYFSPE